MTPVGAEVAPNGAGARIVSFGKRALPWLVAASCLGYAFAVVPLDECWATLRRARLEVFVPLAVVSVLVWFALESAAYAYAFSRFNDVRLSWREARSLRALTYLLTAIHWHLAKAAVVVRLGSTHGVPLLASTSTLLLYQMIGVLVLALFAALGAPFLPSSDGIHEIALASFTVAAGVALALFLIRSDRPRFAWLDEVRGLSLFQAHRRLGLRDFLILGLSRAAYQLVFVLAYHVGLRSFGLTPSFSHVMVATPLLQAVGSLPIAPAGFGTQQAAMLFLFSDPEAQGRDGAAILAFGFSLPIFTMLLRAGLACFYLGELSRPRTGSPFARPGLAPGDEALESRAASD